MIDVREDPLARVDPEASPPPPQPGLTEGGALVDGDDFRRNAWQAFKFCWPFMRPYYSKTLLVGLCDFSLVLLNLVPPWLAKFLIDDAFPRRDWHLGLMLIVGTLAAALVTQSVTALRAFMWGYQEVRLPLDLRNRMYRHLQKLSLLTGEGRPVGQHLYRITTDCDRVAHTLTRIVPHAFYLAEFLLLVSFASYADPLITGIVLLFLIPWTILFWWVTTIGRMLDRRRLWLCEMRDSAIQQGVSTFPLIKGFGRIRHELRKNAKRSVAVQRMGAIGYLILVFFEFATQKVLPYMKTTTIFLYLARKVVLGEMTLGMTVPMTAYLTRLNFPLERIVNFGNWVRQVMISAERMMQILEVEPSIKDRPNARPLHDFRGHVRYEGVSFSRPGVGQVLEDVSLELAPGRKVAVVGPSGAGKSTLLGLLLRHILPESGRVTVEGIDLNDLKLDSFLKRVGIVMQDTFVFGGSVADNLTLARPDATPETMQEALSQVGLGPWLEGLPNGLNTPLLDDGALSVGQRQRLGIARALLTEAPLFLFDEPTSALDATTEREVMETIRTVAQGKAILFVTHRLDTIVDADEILVLDRGRVVQRGTHAELLAEEHGLYAELRHRYATRSAEALQP